MPLLKNKSFEKARLPEFLRDDEEVFFCAMTNEIFRDYDEFCQRIILCNSMVWSCSMTGKAHLTYKEALESEENARRNLKDFPTELRIPVLYLASKTQRTSFGDMAEDVFAFVKDRYFIGENVEATFFENKWRDSHVLQVIAPTEEEIKKASKKKNGNTVEREFSPAALLYKYEIEQYDADDEDISEVMIVNFTQIRRKKGSYSRERNKLFLKQYVELNENGIYIIKQSTLKEHGITKMKFDQIFDGPQPNFDPKKISKNINGKKPRQETLAKFLLKNDVNEKKEKKEADSNLIEQMKKREEEFRLKKELLKQQRVEEKLAEKQKRREENVKISMYLRDWYKPKEDLELEDQKKMPEFEPVECKISDKYFGDALMIMQFIKTFSKLLRVNQFFRNGLTLKLMERALTENEVAGPYVDLIHMLLNAIFSSQDDEAAQYKTVVENSSGVKQEDLADHMSLTQASYLATEASKFTLKHQGADLRNLPLYSLTISEILRLHLLSSGARINEIGARWRFQERGGYTSEDDPGLHLRLHQPHILKALATHSVSELSIDDKVQILSCLTNQLLTYANVRDVVEDQMEKIKKAKLDLKSVQIAEKKRDQEHITAKWKMKKDLKGDPHLARDLDILQRTMDKKRGDNEKKMKNLAKVVSDGQLMLGQDRAFRKYLKLDSFGLFVNFEEYNPGVCLDDIVTQNKKLVGADRTETLLHLRKIHEEINLSDKENEPRETDKMNGAINSITPSTSTEECQELLICSANSKNCVVHNTSLKRKRWSFVKDEEQFEQLVDSLNKRGIRENELRQALETERESLKYMLSHETPVLQLNQKVEVKVEEQETDEAASKKKTGGKQKYDDANLGYPPDMDVSEVLHLTLLDYILDLEEKIHAGNLGSLKIKNRDAWRTALLSRNYEDLDKTITRRENEKNITEKDSKPSTPDPVEMSNDPGKYLGQTDDVEMNSSNMENADPGIQQPENIQEAVHCLAIALAQVAHSVEPKYLKRPLGNSSVSKKDILKKKDLLEQWEQSLLSSSSFSQVFLHYSNLDSCIVWTRSALLARCRTCRRAGDPEKLLLCDNCNNGYHLYCFKPKMQEIPEGKWFCDKCLKEKQLEEKPESPQPVPVKKRRRIFREEESEDEEDNKDLLEVENGEEAEDNKDLSEAEEEEDDDDEDEEKEDEEEDEGEEEEDEKATKEEDKEVESESDQETEENGVVEEACESCGLGGELLCCEGCPNLYHLDCVDPPLKSVPRGKWFCDACKAKRTNKRKSSRESDSDDAPLQKRSRSHRREEGRVDLPLHNVALHELLMEVMRHEDAWPFLRPVHKQEVPDYYDVISKPMDFGTIKYKLNMGEYKRDSEFMADAVLVFENCNTYNDSDAEVYKCGVRLQKEFEKKCLELGLELPSELQGDSESEDEVIEQKSKRRK